MLTKETSAVLAGAIILFLLVSPEVRRPGRAVALTLGVVVAVSLVFPLAIDLAGRSSTGQNYLAWQLARILQPRRDLLPDGHPRRHRLGWWWAAAAAALIFRINRTWRELLLVLWIVVPFVTFEIYPLKGYQYLLPIAPALALLAARGLTTWHLPARWDHFTGRDRPPGRDRHRAGLVGPRRVDRGVPLAGTVGALAGQGGVPGGRAAGKWIGANLVPGTELMTIGPSMANILEYYGHRPAQGLSVSTDPLHRNPAYTPIYNPDLSVRDGQFSYLVWDAYSASRSPTTAHRLQVLVARYHGVPIHTERVRRPPDHRHLRGPPLMRPRLSGCWRCRLPWPTLYRSACRPRSRRPVPPPATTPPPRRAAIQHVIVVMQSGHSFDNYFGTRPGVDGIPAKVCQPVTPSSAA